MATQEQIEALKIVENIFELAEDTELPLFYGHSALIFQNPLFFTTFFHIFALKNENYADKH